MKETLPDSRSIHRTDLVVPRPIWPRFAFMAAVWIAVALYTNERVLTAQILANLAGGGGGILMTEDQMGEFQWIGRLAYGFIPVRLLARVAITALVLQMFTILLAAEIPYRDLFRASLWGFGAVIYGMFIRVLRLDLLGADLTVAELGVVPDSLAALFMNPAPTITTAYDALSFLNIHGLLWMGILFVYLRFESRVTLRHALLIPLAGWTTISLAQLGLHTFAAQILR